RTRARIRSPRRGRDPRAPTTRRPFARPRSHEGLGLALSLLVVVVEALAALGPEPAGEEHAAQQWRCRHARVFEFLEEDVRDVIVDVQAGVVDELEWTHRVAEPELHRLIDVLLRC